MTTPAPIRTKALTFRQQLTLLIRYARDEQGKPYPPSAIAQGIGVSRQGLHLMLQGRSANPELSTVRRACRFFGVPIDYFDGATEADCLRILIRAQADRPTSMIQEIDMQAERLTDKGRRNLLTVIEWLLKH